MSKSALDTEFLSDVWMRIDSVFSEQKVAKSQKNVDLTGRF